MTGNKYINEYIKRVIKHSWTFERLTEIEQKQCLLLLSKIKSKVKTPRGVCNAVNNFYSEFLDILGYQSQGWREPEYEQSALSFEKLRF